MGLVGEDYVLGRSLWQLLQGRVWGADAAFGSCYVWTRPHCLPAFEKLSPRCIYVLGLFVEAVFGFWPKLEELVACRLQSGLEGH